MLSEFEAFVLFLFFCLFSYSVFLEISSTDFGKKNIKAIFLYFRLLGRATWLSTILVS